ncbi:MAG: hypothetical protein E5X53_02780 [Mesorhizobium sp.]|uniref:hypothetical protein n=1 Tax=Mesorhizobium sp. TaxID=1871066 RepID=UPI00121D33EB|nr:hypothetical protein [Mesorhizobium sp.]TIP74571.1 MAG: hypothetical protein E5X55_08390 [Mesorhizobium sp.]TIQ15089.1 MAG: hypothetical protein E5X57_00495 [Mesorhizobium sp.]TIR53929.1 MAG: hypothetical protein E5X53_02780 [Mesorhizobium sp.]TJW00189.1 MAG: hypothetical protein E5X52_00495 [Mesorhizobium sp.]
MSSRYATIITDDDGREVVSAIGEFGGAAPMRHGVEEVPAGVRIGMVRGGPVDQAGGSGFPLAGVSDGSVGIARAALKALPKAGKTKPGAASRPRPKAKRPGKRAKSRKKPTRAVKKTAKPAIAARAGAAG